MKTYTKVLFFLVFLISISIAYASTEYTSGSETTCIGTKCTKTLYSTTTYVQEDGVWKHYTQARSLKDKGFSIKYIENDPMFEINVIDFNATNITVELSTPEINKDVPLRVWKEKEDLNYTKLVEDKAKLGKTAADITYKDKSDLIIDSTLKSKFSTDKTSKTFAFGMDKVIEYGYNSTSITLSAADTENLDDSYIYYGIGGASRDLNFGTSADLYVYYTGDIQHFLASYIKFNLSSIPDDSNIISAIISTFTDDYATNPTFNIYHVYSNISWNEETITYNNAPCGVGGSPYGPTNSGSCNLTAETTMTPILDQYSNATITNIINNSYKNGYNDVSMYFAKLSVYTEFSIDMASKENPASSKRPILFITYEAPQPTGSIIFNTNTTTNNSVLSQSWIYANINISNTSAISRYNITLYNNDSTLNTSYNTSYNKNFTTLSDGTYYLNATFNYSTGTYNTTGLYNYTLDTYNPRIVYNPINPSSANTSTYNTTNIVTFSFNLSDRLINNFVSLNMSFNCTNEANVTEFSNISSFSLTGTNLSNVTMTNMFTNSGNKTCKLNITDRAVNSNVSYFRFGVNGTTVIDLHAYNLWNGSSIDIFNASVEGTIYNTTNGSIYLMFTPAEKDIMVFAPTYNNTFNFTTSAVGSNYTYNVSFYQSTLTIAPRTAAGNISLTSMSISVSNGSVTNTTSNPLGPITFYVNNATYLVNVSVPNGLYFSNSSYFDASGFGTNYTYYVYMSSASYNLSLIDEKTNLAFNISSPDMLTFYVYCDDSYVSITNITNSTFAIPVGCDFDKIKVIVSYPTTVYHRTLLFPRSFNSSLSTIPIYLVDLDTTSIVLDNFQIFTLLNTMQNVKIYFTKNIGANQYVITSNDINLVQSMAAYLMLGEEYTILIEADGIAAYSLGTFTADSSGDRLLRLFEINMSGTPSGAWTDTTWWMSTDNTTTPPRLKIIYNSTNVSIATMNIYNNTLDDTLLYTTSLLSDNGIFYYPPPVAYENYTFFVNLNITKNSGEVITFKNTWNTKNSNELEAISEGFISKTQLNTFLALVLAVIALTFDISTASIGGFVIIGFAALFIWLKWYSIAAVTFGLAILITVVDFFKKKDNQGGP